MRPRGHRGWWRRRGERRTGAGRGRARDVRPLTAVKWRLANGLEIVLAPDPQATTVSYQTWFRVGSRNENEVAGETGLAHLFEHLMFTQTKTMPAGGFDREMEAAGASANAMTSYDFTAYLNDIPPAELAVAARLEADRMLNLDLRKNQVETERDVVVEERLSSVEDSVDGTLEELLFKQAFKTHPYRWPVIGWMKDIKAVTRDKAVAFYRRFYAPGNAVVVLAGKFDAAAVLDLLASSYGPLPASEPPPADDAKPERAPAAEVRATLARPVPADRLVVGFPAPSLADPDRAAYEVAAEILAGGPSSQLPRTLVVDKQWASSVRGDVAPTRDPGLYAIWVQMTKGHTAEEAERIIVDATAALVARPVAARPAGDGGGTPGDGVSAPAVFQPRPRRSAGELRGRGRRLRAPVRTRRRIRACHRRRRPARREQVLRGRRAFGRDRAPKPRQRRRRQRHWQ